MAFGQRAGAQTDPRGVASDGTTPLHHAVRAGDRTTAERLIRSGTQVNAANRYGVTAPSIAAQQGNADLIALLLKAGASVKTAEATLPEGQTLAMLAARTGDVASLKAVLSAGSDANGKESRTGTRP